MMVPRKLEASKQWVERYEVDSLNSSDTYTVSQKSDGTWACSCPHWKFHKAPKPICKHISVVTRSVAPAVPVPRKSRIELFAEKYWSSPPATIPLNVAMDFAEAYAYASATVVEKAPVEAETIVGEFKITRKFRLVG